MFVHQSITKRDSGAAHIKQQQRRHQRPRHTLPSAWPVAAARGVSAARLGSLRCCTPQQYISNSNTSATATKASKTASTQSSKQASRQSSQQSSKTTAWPACAHANWHTRRISAKPQYVQSKLSVNSMRASSRAAPARMPHGASVTATGPIRGQSCLIKELRDDEPKSPCIL